MVFLVGPKILKVPLLYGFFCGNIGTSPSIFSLNSYCFLLTEQPGAYPKQDHVLRVIREPRRANLV